jgi:PQ loop repeat protein
MRYCIALQTSRRAFPPPRNRGRTGETVRMHPPYWVETLGAIAGFCTTFAFVPQLVKIYRQGGRDLSYGMLSFYLGGVLLWLGYGILIHA